MRTARICRNSRDARAGDIVGGKVAGVLIVRPDFERRIDLPGAGPCARPVDIDRSRTGFSDLVSLRVYSFVQGVAIDGEAEGDEVFIVVMRGAADFALSHGGQPVGTFPLRAAGGPRALYMPPNASYRLTAVSDCDVAYARVEPSASTLPAVSAFATAAGRLDIAGYATGMDLALATLSGGEAGLAEGRRAPERFVHLRADDVISATISGEPIGDWDSAALGDGERIMVEVASGTAEILTISASKGRQTASNGGIDGTR